MLQRSGREERFWFPNRSKSGYCFSIGLLWAVAVSVPTMLTSQANDKSINVDLLRSDYLDEPPEVNL